MKPQDFLAYAEDIADKPASGAASFRSAISRAYYSVYLETRDLLRSLGIKTKGGNEHNRLRIYLAESQVAEAAELARLLDNLQQSRKEADYDLHLPFPETQKAAQFAVERARRIREVIARCAVVATPLTEGIAAYKAKTNQ